MKLATYQDGSRDGQLVVVSEDLEMAHFVSECAHTLRQLLEDWNFIFPQLQDISQTLNQGKARHAFPFNPQMCMAPLPRTFQRLGFDAYSIQVNPWGCTNCKAIRSWAPHRSWWLRTQA